MDHLPTAQAQEWLIDALADLIRRRGTKPFISMPLVEPSRRFFPDRWNTPIHGLDRITRRLMQYADLGELEVALGVFDDPGRDDGQVTHSAAALFLGLESNCATFGYNTNASGDVESIAGTMAHEVAHAYRARHGLVTKGDLALEELLTDVTGVFLGFGLLLTNNSYRYRTGGEVVGAVARHMWSERGTGYLDPQAFAFLLAIQLEARGYDESEIRRYVRQLETNQAAFVKAGLGLVRAWPDDVLRRLQFSAPGQEIEDISPESLQAPLPTAPEVVPESVEPTGPEELPNYGTPIFRVPQSQAMKFGALGLLGGAAVAVPIGLWYGLGGGIVATFAGVAVGWQIGARRRYEVCSDPQCDHVIPAEATLCPGCGGTVAGTIRTRSERLLAAERYEARTKAKARRKK